MHLVDRAERYARQSQAANTSRAYASDMSLFEAWAARYGLPTLPAQPATVALYATALADRPLKVSTIRRRCASIAHAHRQAGHLSPTSDAQFLTVLEGITRARRSAPDKKTALLRDPLLEIVSRIDITTNAGLRDRALLLLGFAVGLRRSELVALAVEDLSPSPDGLLIRIAKSKTDQTGEGQSVLVAYAEPQRPCPVRALREWLEAAAITAGPLFRRVTRTDAISSPLTGQSVALVVKRRAQAAGLDPKEFAGHSLRSGYATQAARDGHDATKIAATTRHQDQRVLAGYIHAGRGRQDTATVL